MPSSGLLSALEAYFHRRVTIYLLVIIIFVMGSVFGTLAVNIVNESQQAALASRLDSFFNSVTAVTTGSGSVVNVRTIAYSNILKLVGVVWLLGLSLIGSPLIVLIVFTRGFILGFTTGFIVKSMGLKGVVIALATLLPQNLFYIPAVVIMGVAGIAFTLSIIKSWRKHDETLGAQFVGYTLIALFCALLMAGGTLIESYATPYMVSWLNNLLG